MSIITFLAKDRFNRLDLAAGITFVALAVNGDLVWAVFAGAIGVFASAMFRIAAQERDQRTGE